VAPTPQWHRLSLETALGPMRADFVRKQRMHAKLRRERRQQPRSLPIESQKIAPALPSQPLSAR
jgi:hypothetical protein